MMPELEEIQKHTIPDDFTLPPDFPNREKVMAEVNLRRALQKYLRGMAEKLERGEAEITSEEMFAAMNAIAVEHGCEYGLPMASMTDVTRPLIVAKGAPLSQIPLGDYGEYHQELMIRRISVRNSWHELGDKEVCVVNTTEGPMALPRYDAGVRLRKLIDGLTIRVGTQQTAAAEMKALESLKLHIAEPQWEHYVLGGAFAERSKRSDIHYIFRKGLPTIAFTYHSGYGGDNTGGRVLACLCLHPLGYYQGTHVGLMVPTDEVICHLLMMRGDEHAYWKSCGQWSASDTRSGI